VGGERGPVLMRWFAALLIRGSDGAHIRADLEEAFQRDRARGKPRLRALGRYLVNVTGSAYSVWRAGLRVPEVGISKLDVKLGLRLLRKQPGLTVVAMIALAIGIPVGLAPTHAAIALEAPPPVPGGDRIRIVKYYDTATSTWVQPSPYDYGVWREELRTFEELGATTIGIAMNLSTEAGRAAPAGGAAVTASTFSILRVPALLGRTLTEADEAVGAPRVVVISRDLWQSRLAGDADVIGRVLRIDGVPHEVVGVMPEGFHFPIHAQLWVARRFDAVVDDHGSANDRVFGRLAAGVSDEEARAELATIGGRFAVENPELHERLRPEVVAFAIGLHGFPRDGLYGMVEFYFFQILALTVLTVACVNIGMLFLARTASRSGELAVRTALGASRLRVVSQLFTESLVLAVLAAGAGLIAIDIVANRAFTWLQNAMPDWIDLGVTPRTVLFALVLAVFSAAIVGIIPALKVTGRSVQRNIQRAAANRSGVRFGGLSSVLIVIDVTLAVVTLGIMVATSEMLIETRDGMGISAARYLWASVALSDAEPDVADADADAVVARAASAQLEFLRRLREEPDVGAVAVADVLPGMDHPRVTIEVEGEVRGDDYKGHRVRAARVDPGFFDAFERPILSGRGFTGTDLREGRNAIIVNTTFVDRVLGGRNPIGQRIRYRAAADGEPGPWLEIIGVVGHLGMLEINPDMDQGFYLPLSPGELAAEALRHGETGLRNPLLLAIRTDADAQSFVPRLRAIATAVDAAAIVPGAQRLDAVFSFDRYTIRWIRLGALALVAILLAMSASGTYALMSFTVAQRTREIGIRTALGERQGSLVLTIARRALAQIGLGVVLGLAILGVLLLNLDSQLMRSGMELVLMSLGVGVGVMILVGLIACVAPVRRALRIMPVEALRS
jgi:putative ABC transport system permease protein